VRAENRRQKMASMEPVSGPCVMATTVLRAAHVQGYLRFNVVVGGGEDSKPWQAAAAATVVIGEHQQSPSQQRQQSG